MPTKASAARVADLPGSRLKVHCSLTWTASARRALTAATSPGGTLSGVMENNLLSSSSQGGIRGIIGRRMRQAITQCLREVPWQTGDFPGTQNGVAVPCEVGITFVDDAEMTELNAEYRGKKRPTDVLSFAQHEGADFPGGDAALILGDLVISIDTAMRQAGEQRHDLLAEITFLTIHGTLHLIGYDHGTASARRIMWKWQDGLFESYQAKR